MAVPKRRTSRAKRDMRRRQNERLFIPSLSSCPQCGSPKLPHRVCPNCGTYKNRSVIETE
ncbi:MAG: 50S ribosomal protein L32 [Actinobacteria bacterium]|nr:50S ribosomal protein L32 [Actinomycetota bacterium]